MENSFKRFTNLFPLSKTLKFELIPQGDTLKFIEEHGLLSQDEQRATNYKKVKNIIDEYHKVFISNALNECRLSGLDEFNSLYNIPNRDEKQKKNFEKVQMNLRKEIVKYFKTHPDFAILDKKDLFKDRLKNFVTDNVDLDLVIEFENFTTYFTGFHENRKNIYSDEPISTAIAFRLIHQNLPKFIDNNKAFLNVYQSDVANKFPQLLKGLSQIIEIEQLEPIFQIDNFNQLLTQKGIDYYNTILGGFTTESGDKIKGLNEIINLYNQTKQRRDERLPRLKPLYKQILSDRQSVSFLPENFASDQDVLDSIEMLYQEVVTNCFYKKVDGEYSLTDLLAGLSHFNLDQIFISNDSTLTDLSQRMFGDWNLIGRALELQFDKNYKGKSKPGTEKYETEKQKHLRIADSYSINHLNTVLNEYSTIECLSIDTFYKMQCNPDRTQSEKSLFERLSDSYEQAKDLLNTPYPQERNLAQNQPHVDQLKVVLDQMKAIQWLIKPLLGRGNEADKDERFYAEFTVLFTILDQVTPLYNKVRNYMARKPYSTEKYKLNFENATLLNGWDVNKETDNCSVLLRKDENYFLGIMNKRHNTIFKSLPTAVTNANYKKINYKLLPGASKMLPKVFFGASNIDYYKPNEMILNIRNHGSHTKNGQPQDGFEKAEFNLEDCRMMIDFFKDSIAIHPDWKHFDFTFSPTKTYQSIDQFYREVESQGYKITYTLIDDELINQFVSEGKLYLFQIYNKDFSIHSKGLPNMHTLYWKMLFDQNNLKDVVYKLNGQAEIFYRRASIQIEQQIMHLANQEIKNKNHLNAKEVSMFTYNLIKDKRFTVDKFQFHVPITMNFKAPDLSNINGVTNEFIKEGGIKHIIGIDRGERHLLYATIIDLQGKVVDGMQISLNEIVNNYNNRTYNTNYHALLNEKESSRDAARKNWKTIETIKDLKEGYLSQVVHILSEWIVKYNAILVLEDLNFGFMRGRQKVEKQVYQKFEKMLIDKLNFLVFKNQPIDNPGGLLHAYQLTNKFTSFQKMGKQCGILFYVPAWNTSKIDPATGFVNLINFKYENIEKAAQLLQGFESVKYNNTCDWFEFSMDYNNFTKKAEGTRTQWTVIADSRPRSRWNRNAKNGIGETEIVSVAEQMKILFTRYNVTFTDGKDLLRQFAEIQSADFYKSLLNLLALTFCLRHNNGEKGENEQDYILSPVQDSFGQLYDSRNAANDMPRDADANGAFNIARKGLWSLQQIQESDDVYKVNLAISNNAWLRFAQGLS